MIPQRAPLITTGQVYLCEDKDEYLIITKTNRGQIFYAGDGFRGQSEDLTFIERFKPVDPDDVYPDELVDLTCNCPAGTVPSVGYILPSNDDYYDDDDEDEEELLVASSELPT